MSDLLPSLSPRRIFSLRQVRWHEVDWHVLAVALVVLGVGLVFQHAMDSAERVQEAGGVNFEGHKQKLLLSLPLLVLGMALRPTWLRRAAPLLFVGSLVLLVAVWFVGVERNHARRWIPLPYFDLQPSELAKLGMTLMLARELAQNRLESAGRWIGPLLTLAVPLALVAAQPDLGTALTLIPIAFGLFHLAGARTGALLSLVGGAALVGLLALQLGLVQDYQLRRVETWAASWEADDLIEGRYGPAYHAYQARVAMGNGGLWGQGLGRGVANEARHLPERDSDSVFAVVAEEGGWVGGVGLILLYALLPVLLMLSASRLRDRFARLVVGGVALYFASHLVIHVAVNVGLVPMTGLPLPLVSAGGSSLLATLLALGVALGLAAHDERGLDRDAFRSY